MFVVLVIGSVDGREASVVKGTLVVVTISSLARKLINIICVPSQICTLSNMNFDAC